MFLLINFRRKFMKKNNKLEQLKLDHRNYNNQYKSDKRMQMTFDEYCHWLYGTSKLTATKNKEVIISKPVWANTTDHIPSVIGNNKVTLSRTSMVEKVKTGQIDGDAAIEIISKSKRIGIAYSKGSYQYITEETDLKAMGKKTQGL
jgi:hypothetical protein